MGYHTHTPAPWAAGEPMDGWRVTAADPNRTGKRFLVADIGPAHRSLADAIQARANAHLIAAAPELYEALERLLSGTEKHVFGDECIAERREALAALAKARGDAR